MLKSIANIQGYDCVRIGGAESIDEKAKGVLAVGEAPTIALIVVLGLDRGWID